MGLTLIQRGLSEFGEVNIFYIGGGWCGYTEEAKNFVCPKTLDFSLRTK